MGLEFRRGSDLQRQGVVFASGEPVWTTDTNVLYVGDGVTAGGKAVTPTALNTTTLVVGYAVTASYALTFNTTTLVLQATTATYAGYAYSFNTNTLVTTATSAAYAYSFNTNTLVTTATSAAYAYAFNTNTLVTTAVTAYGLGPGIITISNTTPSTTSTSGALIVAGGVGIGGNVSVAGSIIPNSTASNLGSPTNPFGSIYVSPHTINIGTAPLGSVGNSLQVTGLIVTANTASVSTSTGAITIAGGIGIGGSAVIGDTVTATTAVVVSTATSVSTATGALTVAGGVGIGGNLFVGGNVTSTSQIILGTANTNNTLTGALQVAGGVGIGGNLFVGGIITATSIFAQTLTIDYTTVTQSVIVTPDIFTITNTTNASSTISGALVVSGGAGFGGNVYASQLYDNGLRVITGVNPLPSTYIGIQSLTTNSAVTSFTIVNLGVTNITTGTGILVNNATGTVQITLNTSTLMLQAVTATYALTATSAAYAYAFNTGTLVTTAITATYALTATSAAYAYAFNTGTLVSNAVTASALGTGIIAISNATSSTNTSTGALTVAGGMGIGGALYVANTSYVAGAQIVTSATIGNYVTNFNTNTLVTAAVTATYTLNVTGSSQPAITSVGTLTNVYVSGATHYVNTANVSAVYQYYNTLTNSLDTVFG
jgi:hypothetical protein